MCKCGCGAGECDFIDEETGECTYTGTKDCYWDEESEVEEQ